MIDWSFVFSFSILASVEEATLDAAVDSDRLLVNAEKFLEQHSASSRMLLQPFNTQTKRSLSFVGIDRKLIASENKLGLSAWMRVFAVGAIDDLSLRNTK